MAWAETAEQSCQPGKVNTWVYGATTTAGPSHLHTSDKPSEPPRVDTSERASCTNLAVNPRTKLFRLVSGDKDEGDHVDRRCGRGLMKAGLQLYISTCPYIKVHFRNRKGIMDTLMCVKLETPLMTDTYKRTLSWTCTERVLKVEKRKRRKRNKRMQFTATRNSA